jgi:hypothetical protein
MRISIDLTATLQHCNTAALSFSRFFRDLIKDEYCTLSPCSMNPRSRTGGEQMDETIYGLPDFLKASPINLH